MSLIPKYRRILLKLSGQGLMGDRAYGFDSGTVERERDILREQARATGKPDDIVEKMAEGRLRKYFEDVCLLDQIYVIDGESKVG